MAKTGPKAILCAYGSCEEFVLAGIGTKVTITISHNGERRYYATFCCQEHALRWLQAKIIREHEDKRNE